MAEDVDFEKLATSRPKAEANAEAEHAIHGDRKGLFVPMRRRLQVQSRI